MEGLLGTESGPGEMPDAGWPVAFVCPGIGRFQDGELTALQPGESQTNGDQLVTLA